MQKLYNNFFFLKNYLKTDVFFTLKKHGSFFFMNRPFLQIGRF